MLESIGDPDQRVPTTRQTALHIACSCAPLPQSQAEASKILNSKRLLTASHPNSNEDPLVAPHETRDLSATLKILLMFGVRSNLKDYHGESPLVRLVEEADQAGFPAKLVNGVRQLVCHGARFDDHPAEDLLKKPNVTAISHKIIAARHSPGCHSQHFI